MRPTRPAEKPRTFLEALQEKYAGDGATATARMGTGTPSRQIVISGKVAEEIGFDKIRQQQGQLGELRIVILDGLRIGSVANDNDLGAEGEEEKKRKSIQEVCPKVVELDLSRNLFTGFGTVVDVCAQLKELRGLRLKYVTPSLRLRPFDD